MKTTRRAFTAQLAALGAASTLPGLAAAQPVPGNAIVTVPFPAGGTTDVLARILADKLRGSYARSVTVDNRAGAGGRIGIAHAKGAATNGSAMLVVPASMMALYPHVFKDMPYNPLTDFVPVGRLCATSFMAVVGPAVPEQVKTLADFVAWCNADPSRAMYGSPSMGSTPHLLAASMGPSMKVPFTHVPYNGGAPTIAALLGGQVPLAFLVYTDARAHKESGKVRVLATSGPQRSPFLPEVPTVREAGFPALEVEEWFGVFVPARTRAEQVAALSKAVNDALSSAEMAEMMGKQALLPLKDSPQAFAAALRSDHDMWARAVKSVGFVAQ